MKAPTTFARLCLAAALLGSLGACTIAPAYPPGYRAPPVVVETYPAYRYGYPYPAYQYGHRHNERGGYFPREDRHHGEARRSESPLEGAARMHRDVRRSLGLPRLPGMP